MIIKISDQIRSVAQSFPTLCDPMNRSTPDLPVHHQLLEFTQTHIHQVSDAISSSVIPFFSCPQFLPASESCPMSQLFSWGGQNTGVSASASFLPKNTQDWSLEWTGWSPCSPGDSQESSPTPQPCCSTGLMGPGGPRGKEFYESKFWLFTLMGRQGIMKFGLL